MSTAPLARWALNDRIEVGMMMASEVPTQSGMRTASGTERSDEEGKFMPTDGDTMIASFECTGISGAMMQIKIVGTLQGTVASGVFTGRTLNGTWIELGGKTGDINGQTTSVAIAPVATTETATEETAAE